MKIDPNQKAVIEAVGKISPSQETPNKYFI